MKARFLALSLYLLAMICHGKAGSPVAYPPKVERALAELAALAGRLDSIEPEKVHRSVVPPSHATPITETAAKIDETVVEASLERIGPGKRYTRGVVANYAVFHAVRPDEMMKRAWEDSEGKSYVYEGKAKLGGAPFVDLKVIERVLRINGTLWVLRIATKASDWRAQR